MGRVTETVQTVNSAIRTLLILVVTGVLGTAGFLFYERVNEDSRELAAKEQELTSARATINEQTLQIQQLGSQVAEQAKEIERLDMALNLLKVDQRLARLEVVDQKRSEEDEDEVLETTVRFTELTPDGDPIGTGREFTVKGDVVYIDNWVVKFEDKFVEQADLARGTSLTLFRRIFGEYQSPNEGFQIDEVGSQPQAYASGGIPSDFEQNIWDQFWTFANNRELAQEQGIRAAHGEAVSIKAEEGKSYRVVLRASDGLSIVPEEG